MRVMVSGSVPTCPSAALDYQIGASCHCEMICRAWPIAGDVGRRGAIQLKRIPKGTGRFRTTNHILRAADLPGRTQEAGTPEATEDSSQEPVSFWQKIRNAVFGGTIDMQRIRALGIGAVLSYGFVSNTTYGACIVVAWVTHVKKTGLTPLAPGQWAGFLAVYAALWALQNVLRPIRFAVAVAITPIVDRMLTYVQNKLQISKAKAFAVLLVSLAIFSISYLLFFLWIFGGFPQAPPAAKIG